MHVVTNLNMPNLGHSYNMIIKVSKRKPPTLDPGLQDPTEALHRECPICPNGTAGLNSISKMKKSMHCNRAGGEMLR